MKPIWYFVGILLLIVGVILVCTDIYLLFSPVQNPTVLSETRPNLWWGIVMVIVGFVFIWTNRKAVVR